MTTTTLIRTRRRTRRNAEQAPPDLAVQVMADLTANRPVMVTVAGLGRGWWVVDATPEQVVVRRHGETMPVDWSSVELDA